MIVWFAIIAAVLLGLGEIFVIAAAGTFKRGLEWPDFVAMAGPLVALLMLVVFFSFLSWPIALILSLGVIALTIWGVGALLKVPAKKQAR